MSTHAHAIESHETAPARTFVFVWLWLVAITGVEVFLAYKHVPPGTMLAALICLSVIKAGLIMAYFMHLKFEKFALVLLLVPALVFCICIMLAFFFQDSFRLLRLGSH